MGRFDDLMKAMGNAADPKLEEGDETAIAENPRNWATDKLNMALPDQFQIVPQTVAEDKRFMQELPQNMAGSTMGSIGKPKVGNTISHTDVMGHPMMKEFLDNKPTFKANNPHPSQYDNAKQNTIEQIRKLLLGQ